MVLTSLSFCIVRRVVFLLSSVGTPNGRSVIVSSSQSLPFVSIVWLTENQSVKSLVLNGSFLEKNMTRVDVKRVHEFLWRFYLQASNVSHKIRFYSFLYDDAHLLLRITDICLLHRTRFNRSIELRLRYYWFNVEQRFLKGRYRRGRYWENSTHSASYGITWNC